MRYPALSTALALLAPCPATQAQEIAADALRAAKSGNTPSAMAGSNQVQAYYAPDGRVTLRITANRMSEHIGTWEIEG